MRKVFLTAVVIASLGIVSASAAQSHNSFLTEQTTKEFVKIEVSALPQVVTDAIAKEYEGATVKEAFLEKETNLYKVVITISAEKEETVIYNEKGEVQKS